MTPAEQAARDELAKALKAGYGPIILEADEWRPIADHMLAAIEQARQSRPACLDCEYTDTGGVFPCVRHHGPEHGLAGFWPGNTDWDDTWEHWKRRCLLAEAAIEQARREEREACAVLVEQCEPETGPEVAMLRSIAAAIRARAQEQP